MTDFTPTNPPSPFIARWVPRVAAERPCNRLALDYAMGRGRHATLMAAHGFHVIGLDWQFEAVSFATQRARDGGWPIAAACVDLTRLPLPPSRFQLMVVSRYLDRASFPMLREALAPGGVLLYETFTTRQLAHARGPRSPAHLLAPGELRLHLLGMDLLFDEECTEPDAVARIAARRR